VPGQWTFISRKVNTANSFFKLKAFLPHSVNMKIENKDNGA